MQTFERLGRTLHFRIDGPREGAVVVLANSLGTDMRVWDAMLSHMPTGLRYLRLDKPGHGLSDAPSGHLKMDELVDDVAALCDAQGITRAMFVGLSIGGMIGQGVASKRPDLLRGLVLMDTAAKIGTPDMWQTRIDAITKDGIGAMAAPILERWFTEEFRNGPEFPLWRNMLLRTDVIGYTACCAAIAGADLTESTAALTLPVMAMAGDQDGSTPPDLVRATADLCGAQFHLIANAGHLPCVEQPAQTAALISDFIDRTPL
ncbi:3-oxoadipate enol-lactonase [Thioclava sp. SK-1]|uniref:3-oxoadipate enol-lactonase n=1 Tax=Thioclava sp. SK-1 TaxID=1889770 RepID=UPI000824DEA1|nr:3-oxoadipate enol-lactonase [Thioclava sp. SK-1]OCX67351.1 3-oxoadipate enol-lactonase [Thioclava sp. SK-1]